MVRHQHLIIYYQQQQTITPSSLSLPTHHINNVEILITPNSIRAFHNRPSKDGLGAVSLIRVKYNFNVFIDLFTKFTHHRENIKCHKVIYYCCNESKLVRLKNLLLYRSPE